MVSKKNKILSAIVGAGMAIKSVFSAEGAEEAINRAGETFLGLGEVGADWLLIFSGVVLFFSLVFIGIQYMWARKGEDGDKLRTVNNWFKAWVIGFIIILVAWGAKGFFFSFGQ